MKKQHYQWVLLSLGLAVSVGCTVPFLVNTRDATGGVNGGNVITDPNAVASSLPIFLPQPGSTTPPLILGPSSGPFQPVASGNPPIIGGLPAPTATPFLSNIAPNIDNQIIANPLPVLQANGGLTSTQPIVPSVIRGRVLGYHPATGNYQILSNAQVRIDGSLSLTTDANGFYETTQEFNRAVTISAGAAQYIGSTVTDVPPGINRDIHLNPLDNRIPYRQDSFALNGSVTNLAQNGRRALVVFTDGIQSVSHAAYPEVGTGRFNMTVRLPANRSSTTGTLFGSISEQVGKLSVITQYGYSPNVQVPVPPPQPVPTATPDLSGVDTPVASLKPTDLLMSFNHLVSPEAFGELSVNFTAPAGSGLQGVVLHVYMNLPDGGRVLVAKYDDNTSTTVNQRIRVPRLPNTSFTLIAHSSSALKGSDIVVPNIQLGSTITRSFLPPPNFTQLGSATDFSDPRRTHFQTSDLTPRITWSSQSNVNSYQLDLQTEIPDRFRWEAYTLGTSLNYPDFGTDHALSLKSGQTYRLQLMASDFDIGTFNILNEGDAWRPPSRFDTLHAEMAGGGFGIQLRNPSLNNFAQGYRIAYHTISFVTD